MAGNKEQTSLIDSILNINPCLKIKNIKKTLGFNKKTLGFNEITLLINLVILYLYQGINIFPTLVLCISSSPGVYYFHLGFFAR